MFVMGRHLARAGALVAGFATLALSPLHNYVFAHAFVLFSDIVGDTMRMSPLDYARALIELIRLDVTGEHVRGAIDQLGSWLSGPEGLLVMVPVHVLAVAVLVRVAFAARFGAWLRLVALATLLQHGIGVSYVNFARYSLGTWLLTLLVVAAWLDREGLALVCRGLPGLCQAWARNSAVARLGGLLATWTALFGLADSPQRLLQNRPKDGILTSSLTVP
jgi:hypothetical protein